MFVMLMFLSLSAAITLLIIGIVRTVKKEDAYFIYLSSVLLFCVAIATMVYMSWRNTMYSNTVSEGNDINLNIEAIFGMFALLMLIVGIITGIALIVSAVTKKNAIVPGMICGISFSLSVLSAMILFFIAW